MHSYTFGLEIDPIEENKTYESLPLHCTLMHWFYCKEGHAKITACVLPVFERSNRIEIVSYAPALFGRANTIPVHTIAANRALKRLHAGIFTTLIELGVVFSDPDYVGTGYNPHVTTKGKQAFLPQTRALVRHAYLVEKIEHERQCCKIVRKLFTLA